MIQNNSNKKPISTATIILMTVIAMDILRSITLSAQCGYSLISYFLAAGLLFLIPSALVTAELSSALPRAGGLYVWIKEAFGHDLAVFVIWLQWLYNICWYPTILAFLGVALIYPYAPELASSSSYIFSVVVLVYWLITYINMQGIEASALLSRITAIFGTLLPLIVIITLGLYWIMQGNKPVIDFSYEAILPSVEESNNWIFLSTIVYSLLGIEITAYHARDINNPQKNFPRALLWASVIILTVIISTSLAVAVVIPREQLQAGLISGMFYACRVFFAYLHMSYLFPLMCFLIALGSVGTVGMWVIGPSKGLLVAAEDGCLPKFFAKKNKHGVQQNILICQGVTFTALSLIYLIMPSVTSAYFVMSILTAQLALFGYIFIFLAAIKLRKNHPHLQRPFKIPGGEIGLYLTCGVGLFSSIATLAISFIPPEQVYFDNYFSYELLMFTVFSIFLVIVHKSTRVARVCEEKQSKVSVH